MLQTIISSLLVHARHGLAALAAMSLLALAACGAGDDSEAASGETIDFTYRDISVTIPADPERVVVIEGRGDLEFALMAGYNVVGTRSGASPDGELPGNQFEGMLDPKKTTVLSSGEVTPSYEEITALDPDLIIMRVNAWNADWYGNDKLSKIAPVLPIEANHPDIREATLDQLKILGREDNAQEYVDAYDEAVASAAERVAGVTDGQQVAMLTTQGIADGTFLVWTNLVGTQVAHDIGLDVMYRVEGDTESFEEWSTERLTDLSDAGAIFYQTQMPEQTEELPIWQNLPAVEAGRSYTYPLAYNNGLLITGAAIADYLADSLSQVG